MGLGDRECFVATIELTNGSKHAISYVAQYRNAEHSVLQKTKMGWQETKIGHGWCGTGVELCTLPPLRATNFTAIIDTDLPWKVAVNYSDGRKPSRLWRLLPQWLAATIVLGQ